MRRHCLSRSANVSVAALVAFGFVPDAVAQDRPWTPAPAPIHPPPWSGDQTPAPADPPQSQPSPGLKPESPAELPYKEGDPIPPGYRLVSESRSHEALEAYGAFALCYTPALIVAIVANFKRPLGYLAIPIVGPALMIPDLDWSGCRERSDCSHSGEAALIFGLDAIGQAAAVAGALSAHLSKRSKLVRSDLAWSVAPQRVGSGYGVAAVGMF
jgi:hypothetical protein